MSFTIAVGEDGYIKNKELVAIFTSIFLLLMLFFTKKQPELVYVALSLFVILATIYLYRACVKVAIFTYQKACIIFLQVREQNSQVIGPPSPCVFEIATLKHIAPELLDDSMSVLGNTMEPEISNFLESGPAHAIELEHESMALNAVAIDVSSAVEPKILEVTASNILRVVKPEMESLSLVEPVTEAAVEPEASIQCVSVEGRSISPEESNSSVSEYMEETFFVSRAEIRTSLRVEAYLATEHAAAYLGMSVEDFNQLVKIKFKVCGKEKFYKINTLNCFIQKESACVWTKLLDPTYQERLISEHSMLTTDKAAIFLNKSEKNA